MRVFKIVLRKTFLNNIIKTSKYSAPMSAKDATMSAKDATMSGKDATMNAKDATRIAKPATSAADAETSAAFLKRTIASHKSLQAPPPRPPFGSPPPLSSRVFNINTQIIIFGNLVNPSIPKMEVLDACFQNCIKENVSQQYIFKTF